MGLAPEAAVSSCGKVRYQNTHRITLQEGSRDGQNKRIWCRFGHRRMRGHVISFPQMRSSQEEPAMRKSEKLDLILSELTKLRGEVTKLVRDRAAVADQGMKTKLRSAPSGAKKPSKRSGASKKPDR